MLSAVPAEACRVIVAPAPPPGPVVISKDADFIGHPAVDGGSGTALDPYRIEDLRIEVEGASGVRITGTNAYFVLRNVTVVEKASSGSYSSCCRAGIELWSMANGTVVGATVRGTQQGISLGYVADVTVADSRIEGANQGLVIQDSSRVTLRRNLIVNSTATAVSFSATSANQAGSHAIAEDNLVDGYPILYRGNCGGAAVSDQVFGAVVIGNCTGVSLHNLTAAAPGSWLNVMHSTQVALDEVRGGVFRFWYANQTSVRRSQFTALSADNFADLAIEASRSPAGNATQIRTQSGTRLRIEGNEFQGGGREIIQIGGYFATGWCSCLGPPPPVSVTESIVTGNLLYDSGGSAVRLIDAPGAVVTGNQMLNVSAGVVASPGRAAIVEENRIVGQGDYGPGIETGGEGSRASNNTIDGFDVGISVGNEGSVLVAGNTIAAKAAGIQVSAGSHIVLSDNRMEGGSVYSNGVSDWGAHDLEISADNTVNGLPIVYHNGCANVAYDGEALGELILTDCENVTLSNLHFDGVSSPLILGIVQNFTIENLSVNNATNGVAIRTAYVGRVANNRLNNTGGMAIGDAWNITFESNALTNGTAGFSITTSAGLEFRDNTVESAVQPPMSLYQAYELTLERNAFEGGGVAFYGPGAEEVASHTIDGTNTVDGQPLVYLRDSVGATLEDRSLGELVLANCTGVSVRNVTVEAGGPGIVLASVALVRFANVTAASRSAGAVEGRDIEGLEVVDSVFHGAPVSSWSYGPAAVSFSTVHNLTLRRTTVNSTGYSALSIDGGSGVVLEGGSFEGGPYGQGAVVQGLSALRVAGARFSGAYGGLQGASLHNASIEDSQFESPGGGLWLDDVRQTKVLRNTIEGTSYRGLSLSDATDVRVEGNAVHGSLTGLALYGGQQNVSAAGNTFSQNEVGVFLDLHGYNGPLDVQIFDNTVEGNGVGVRGNASEGVQVFHNRFLNNTVQARVSPGALWDAGYLVGGNFWSDYRGSDACSGPAQDVCPDPDQFGDTPYCLGAITGGTEAVDRYPLMNRTPPPARDPPPYVAPPVSPPVPGVMDPTAAGLSGAVLILGVVGTAALLTAHARARRKEGEEGDDEAERGGP